MTKKWALAILALGTLGLSGAAIAQAAAHGLVITNFSSPQPLSGTGLDLRSPRDFSVSDWSRIQDAIFELESHAPRQLKLTATLHNQVDASDEGTTAGFYVIMTPTAKLSWRLPIFPLKYTARWEFPLQKGFAWYGGWGYIDTEKIVQITVKVEDDEGKSDLRLASIRLEGSAEHKGWIDQWGQHSKGSWPGKVTKDQDMIDADAAEVALLKKSPRPANRTDYQGWTGMAPRKATGFFRTEKIDGRWWLITPKGHLYFVTGIDCVGPGAHARNDATARNAYSWLPPKEGLFAAAWWKLGSKEETFALYRANLIRKWGKDFEEKWYERMPLRMQAWGFSSIGNWSDDRVMASHILPYVTMGPETWGAAVPYVSKNLQDAYHPGFPAETKRAAQLLAKTYKDDPYLIGHFVGNEMDWHPMPAKVLEKGPSTPARKHFIKLLQKKYASIEKVNDAWGSSASSWAKLRLPKEKWGKTAEADAAQFRGEFAELWFSTWAKALKEADPNHLFLGSRIHGGGNRSDEVIVASGRHCDIVSFNDYSERPDPVSYDRWQALVDKPFMIGEYTFNSLDDGLLASAVPVADRVAKGDGYRYYTEQMAALPYFIGGHYFQFTDEPITGRGDRETSYNGFVRVTDLSDPHLVKAATTSNSRVEEIHAGKKKPFSTRPRRY